MMFLLGIGVGLLLPYMPALLARLRQREHPADTRKRMVEWLAGMRKG